MSAEKTSEGFGLGTILFLIFLVLKLTHVIGWSWWWVTAPLWIPAGIVVALLLFSLVFLLIVAAVGYKATKTKF